MKQQHIKDPQLKGIQNFRDAGGHELPAGQRMRMGWLYRSGQFEKARAADIQMINKLGIKLLIDLRPKKEWLKMPEEFTHIHQLHLETDITSETMKRLQPYLNKRNVEKEIIMVMRSIYVDLVEWIGPHLHPLFEALSKPENYPVVVHCRGGKDRTGVVIATIQSFLGLDRKTMLSHYAETNNFLLPQAIKAFRKFKWMSFGMFPSHNYLAAYTAHEHLLEAFLDQMQSQYGNVHAYLVAHKVTIEQMEAVKHLLIENTDSQKMRIKG